MDWKRKLTSRKFLMSLAAFLMSFGTGIAGLASGDDRLAMTGGICCVLSGAIYAAAEAYVDGKYVANESNVYISTGADDDAK